ncbi:MAG: cache domain-containing protein [Deltaproteobacteria bacterium]|jgi:signal transduction histidine kinase/CheY-like chemotaxis protein|nr:cache domain-containing protein [Deltaproteobacteria bacterium]
MVIRTKLLINTVAPALFVALAILVFNSILFSDFVDEAMIDRVNSASKVAEHHLSDLKERATSASLSMAQNREIIHALMQNDRKTLSYQTAQMQDETEIDFCTIADPEGRVIFRMHAPKIYGDSIAQHVIAQAAIAGKKLTAVEKGSWVRLSIRAGAPIIDDQGAIVGIVLVGYRLDADRYVDEIKEISGCETTVYLDNERVSTTVRHADGTRAIGTTVSAALSDIVLGGKTYAGRVDILGRAAVVRCTPISGPEGQVVGMLLAGRYVDDATQVIQRFVQNGLLITLALLTLATMAILVIVRHIVRPIQTMTRAASALAVGDIDIDVQVQTNDEMHALADSFSRMVESARQQVHTIHQISNGDMTVSLQPRSENDLVNRALVKLNEILQAQHAAIMAEHSNLRDTSAKLEAALADAKEANSTKSNFLARMSHEIRTPLSAVIGLSELTLGEEGLTLEAESNLEKIYSAGSTILHIVNDILDISKIESGKFEIHPVRYDTPSLINDTVTLNIVRIQEKPIVFRLHVDENLPAELYGDDLRVKQIFNNLLSNAFKFTNSGAVEWRLSFEKEADAIWLVSSVRDTGMGITQENLQKLFSDYSQVDSKINRRVEGTGLGLAITKCLVEMMDGTITVESRYGEGSVFHVRLRQTVFSSTPIGKKVAANLMGLHYTLAKCTRRTKLARVDLSYAHVLVVDDIETNLDVAKGMLRPYAIKIDCATSGRQAVDMIRAENPRYSAIFMDHMMPGMDGVEATKIIRQEIGTDYARNIPIIALTANAIAGNEEMFLNNGFQAFISKPIDVIRLDSLLRRWVRDKNLEKELSATGEAAYPVHNEKRDDGSERHMLDGITISGVDIHKACKNFGDNETVFIDVLRSYAANTRLLLHKLPECLAAENFTDYGIVIHGIKGSSYGIVAQEVGKKAELLESAIKAGDFAAVQAGHSNFMASAEALIADIDAALSKINTTANKPNAIEPAPALLHELRDACAAFDMDRVDKVMALFEEFQYERGGELIVWLREQIDMMNFEKISKGEWT